MNAEVCDRKRPGSEVWYGYMVSTLPPRNRKTFSSDDFSKLLKGSFDFYTSCSDFFLKRKQIVLMDFVILGGFFEANRIINAEFSGVLVGMFLFVF